jgi:hypothetical protein
MTIYLAIFVFTDECMNKNEKKNMIGFFCHEIVYRQRVMECMLGLRHSERSWHYEQPDKEVLKTELIATKSTEDSTRQALELLSHLSTWRYVADLSRLKIKMLCTHF